MPGLFNVTTDTENVIKVRDKLDSLIKAIYQAEQQGNYQLLLKRAELLYNHKSLLAFYADGLSSTSAETFQEGFIVDNLVAHINLLNVKDYTQSRNIKSCDHAINVLDGAKRWSNIFYFTGGVMLAVGVLAIVAIAIAMALSNSAALPVVGFALKCSLIYGGLGFLALGLLTAVGALVETYAVRKGTSYFNRRLKQNYGASDDDTFSVGDSHVGSSQDSKYNAANDGYASIVDEFAKIEADKEKNSSPNYS